MSLPVCQIVSGIAIIHGLLAVYLQIKISEESGVRVWKRDPTMTRITTVSDLCYCCIYRAPCHI